MSSAAVSSESSGNDGSWVKKTARGALIAGSVAAGAAGMTAVSNHAMAQPIQFPTEQHVNPLLQQTGAPPSSAEIQAQRDELIQYMLHGAPESVAGLTRGDCAFGITSRKVIQSRNEGALFEPDASDKCIAALTRKFNTGRLYEMYDQILNRNSITRITAQDFAEAVYAAANNNVKAIRLDVTTKFDIHEGAAFDAGFVKGVSTVTPDKNPMDGVNRTAFKAAVEKCLAGNSQDFGLCAALGVIAGQEVAFQKKQGLASR